MKSKKKRIYLAKKEFVGAFRQSDNRSEQQKKPPLVMMKKRR
jgi:hypothetical protein